MNFFSSTLQSLAESVRSSIIAPPAPHLRLAIPPLADEGAGDVTAMRLLADAQFKTRRLLARFELLALMRRSPPGARERVVRRLCVELAVHLQVEDEVLYPRLRGVLDDTSAVDRAEVDHICLRKLIERVIAMDADAPSFEARVRTLAELFELHLRFEMSRLLPQVRHLPIDPHQLGAWMATRRYALLTGAQRTHKRAPTGFRATMPMALRAA